MTEQTEREQLAEWLRAAFSDEFDGEMSDSWWLAKADEALAVLHVEPTAGGALTCEDCGRLYGHEHGFPDLLIPNWAWEKIMPGRVGGGMLCPSCIVARCVAAGLTAVPAMWASGPLRGEPYRDGDNGGREWLVASRSPNETSVAPDWQQERTRRMQSNVADDAGDAEPSTRADWVSALQEFLLDYDPDSDASDALAIADLWADRLAAHPYRAAPKPEPIAIALYMAWRDGQPPKEPWWDDLAPDQKDCYRRWATNLLRMASEAAPKGESNE